MELAAWLDGLGHGGGTTPEEVGELRAHVEGSFAGIVGAVEVAPCADEPLRMGKALLADLGRCERLALARVAAPRPPLSTAMLRGIALDLCVIQELHAGPVLDPLVDLSEVLAAGGRREEHEALQQLPAEEASALTGGAASAARAWRDLDPAWVPRTQVGATAVFLDGAVVVSGRTDVELGGLDTGRPGVVVEVKSGEPSASHLAETYLYALLCALRDGAAPAWAACWYPGRAPSATPVSPGLLEAAAGRLLDGVVRWVELVAGRAPREAPGGWCTWCPDSAVCPSVATAHGAMDAPRPDGSDT